MTTKTNEEPDTILTNPANRLLIELNSLKNDIFKRTFKEMENTKNLNYNKTLKIIYKNEILGKGITDITDEVAHVYSNLTFYLFAIQTWRKWKKIYNFDSELINYLNNQADNTITSNLTIPKDFLSKLPYETFFINADNFMDDIRQEFGEDITNAPKCNGFFVILDDVVIEGIKQKILTFVFPGYVSYTLKDGKNDSLNINDYSLYSFDPFVFELALIGNTVEDFIKTTIESLPGIKEAVYRKGVMRCISYLMYILTANADIADGSITTYRPKKKKESIADIISEVQTFNVGYRIGAALKRYGQQNESISTGSGKKKIPHTRRGHWHHYWVGPRNSDNRELIVHWIPPIAINSNWKENPIVEVTPANKKGE